MFGLAFCSNPYRKFLPQKEVQLLAHTEPSHDWHIGALLLIAVALAGMSYFIFVH